MRVPSVAAAVTPSAGAALEMGVLGVQATAAELTLGEHAETDAAIVHRFGRGAFCRHVGGHVSSLTASIPCVRDPAAYS